MVIQATIWSGRQHCEAAVYQSLMALRGVDKRLWLVHSGTQAMELFSDGVDMVRLTGPVVPQYGPRSAHALACLRSWKSLWTLIRGLDGSDVMLIDDDMVVPADAAQRLAPLARQYGAASGLARTDDGKWPMFDREGWQWPQPPAAPAAVDFCGTFCFYLTGAAIARLQDTGYEPDSRVPGVGFTGHDLHLCHAIRAAGLAVWLDPAVRCDHHVMLGPQEYVIRREIR